MLAFGLPPFLIMLIMYGKLFTPVLSIAKCNVANHIVTQIQRRGNISLCCWDAPNFSTTYNERVSAFTLDCPASPARLVSQYLWANSAGVR